MRGAYGTEYGGRRGVLGLVQGKKALRHQRLLLKKKLQERRQVHRHFWKISAWERLAEIWALDVLFAAAACNGNKSWSIGRSRTILLLPLSSSFSQVLSMLPSLLPFILVDFAKHSSSGYFVICS